MMMLTTMIGAQVTPQDYNSEMVRTTPAQSESQRSGAVAGVAIGGKLVFQLADSGLSMAEERAIETRENLNRAIFHYDIAHKYLPIGLRTDGRGSYVELYYFDLRLATATAADAKAAGLDSAEKLVNVWKGDVDRSFRALPKPMVDGWIATTGSVAGTTMISDDTLAGTASSIIGYTPGAQVKLTAKAGVILVEGVVASDAQRGRIIRTLKRLPGVRGVQDRLEVSATKAR
jgi:hypothetical protein